MQREQDKMESSFFWDFIPFMVMMGALLAALYIYYQEPINSALQNAYRSLTTLFY